MQGLMMNNEPPVTDGNVVLQDLARDYLSDKKRKRRWSIFFRTLFVLLLGFIAFNIYQAKKSTNTETTEDHIALIDISGPIFDMAKSNADDIAYSLRAAFESESSQAIILRINSPGGSPVEADYIFNEIMRLRDLHPETPVFAVCTEACLSAAYYIAAAADEIYANPNSLVGSIGVLFNGFGFSDTLEKMGIERRLVTAGEYKGFMDPFSPINETEESHLQDMLNTIHSQFTQQILQGRDGRLSDNSDIFSGLLWTGSEAKTLGLIDELGSTGYVARDVIGIDNIYNYTVQPSYFERLFRELSIGATSEIADRIGLRAQPIHG